MEKKQPELETREITKMLADLDLLFSVTKGTDGQPLWSLMPFADDSTEAIRVVLAIQENFLHVFSLQPITADPQREKLLKILELNTRLAMAKVGITGETEFPPALRIGFQIPPALVDAEMLKLAIGAVISGAREAKKILAA